MQIDCELRSCGVRVASHFLYYFKNIKNIAPVVGDVVQTVGEKSLCKESYLHLFNEKNGNLSLFYLHVTVLNKIKIYSLT